MQSVLYNTLKINTQHTILQTVTWFACWEWRGCRPHIVAVLKWCPSNRCDSPGRTGWLPQQMHSDGPEPHCHNKNKNQSLELVYSFLILHYWYSVEFGINKENSIHGAIKHCTMLQGTEISIFIPGHRSKPDVCLNHWSIPCVYIPCQFSVVACL